MIEGERQRQKQAPCREPGAGLDPGTPGSRPGPKAGAKPTSHSGRDHDSCVFKGVHSLENLWSFIEGIVPHIFHEFSFCSHNNPHFKD